MRSAITSPFSLMGIARDSASRPATSLAVISEFLFIASATIFGGSSPMTSERNWGFSFSALAMALGSELVSIPSRRYLWLAISPISFPIGVLTGMARIPAAMRLISMMIITVMLTNACIRWPTRNLPPPTFCCLEAGCALGLLALAAFAAPAATGTAAAAAPRARAFCR